MKDDFDPFNATQKFNDFEQNLAKLDPAWAKAALYFRSGGDWHYGHDDGSMCMRGLLDIWQELETRREGFEAGDTIELLHAIQCCAKVNLPLPTWLAVAFDKQFTATLIPGGPVSLDEAFAGRDYPQTPAKRAKLNRDWQRGGLLLHKAYRAATQDSEIRSIDAALDAIQKDMKALGIGKTRARELIDMLDANQARLVPGYQRFSDYLAKRRKQ